MNIYVVSSVGRGTTLLSAFDKALYEAGVHNYNLLSLSSIIPPGAKIIKTDKYQAPQEDFGDRLYVVKAEIRSDEAGKFIGAGLGWYQLEDGRGFFVEHYLEGETEEALRKAIDQRIRNSLKDMCQFRKINFDERKLNSSVAVAQIKDKPTSVLTIAIYQSERWLQH